MAYEVYQWMRCAGASNSFWVKNPRPSEEPATPTRRSKKARPLRRGISDKYGHERQDVHLLGGLYLPRTGCFFGRSSIRPMLG
jgi:hypothetical protein